MARLYPNGADPRSPLAAPIYADLVGLPPLWSKSAPPRCCLTTRCASPRSPAPPMCASTFRSGPEMIHVWHLFHPELKAGLRVIEAGGDVIRRFIA